MVRRQFDVGSRVQRARTASSVFLLFACAASLCAEVKVFPSKTNDVRQYGTYTWLAPRIFTSTGTQEDDPVYAPLIRESINRELARKGYQEVNQGGQMQVITAAISSKSSQLDGYLLSFGFNYYNGYYGPATAAPLTRVNREGALAIALYDPKLKSGVWSAYILEALGRPGNPGKTISNAAGKLLKKLPERKR